MEGRKIQAAGGQHKRPTIIVYPPVAPETIIIPIISCIFGFPILALLVICCLRRRAKLARERERRRAGNCGTEGGMSLARFSPMHKLDSCGESNEQLLQSAEETTSSAADSSWDDEGIMATIIKKPTGVYLAGPGGSQRARAVSLRSDRALSRGFPSLELDTVVEEPSS